MLHVYLDNIFENLVNNFYIPVYTYQVRINDNRLPKHQSTPFLMTEQQHKSDPVLFKYLPTLQS